MFLAEGRKKAQKQKRGGGRRGEGWRQRGGRGGDESRILVWAVKNTVVKRRLGKGKIRASNKG